MRMPTGCASRWKTRDVVAPCCAQRHRTNPTDAACEWLTNLRPSGEPNGAQPTRSSGARSPAREVGTPTTTGVVAATRKWTAEYVDAVTTLLPRASGTRLVVCGLNVLPAALVGTRPCPGQKRTRPSLCCLYLSPPTRHDRTCRTATRTRHERRALAPNSRAGRTPRGRRE